MKWIKYRIVQSTPGGQNVFANKKIGYNQDNLAIAQAEAYDGYTIEDDNTPEPKSGTEDWVFTLEDGSTVTKVVCVK